MMIKDGPMNRLSDDRRELVLACLSDGCSLRATARITGHARNTVSRLLRIAGEACAEFQADAFRGLRFDRLECDELWGFCGCKEKNVAVARNGGIGSVWTWISVDPDTKLAPAWLLGDRSDSSAEEFMRILRSRHIGQVQITTDGLSSYESAVEEAYGSDANFAMKVKQYEKNRYVGCQRRIVSGSPDKKLISTSGIERLNLELRMGSRRWTRKTSAFSKKLSYMRYAASVFFMVYNFVRIHGSLSASPAMAAGVTPHLWELSGVVGLISN